jgi:hypothetical protein
MTYKWQNVSQRTSTDIIFQHPVALVNNLVCMGNLDAANSCHAHRLLVCYVASVLQMSLVQHIFILHGHHQVDAFM